MRRKGVYEYFMFCFSSFLHFFLVFFMHETTFSLKLFHSMHIVGILSSPKSDVYRMKYPTFIALSLQYIFRAFSSE